MPPYCDPTEKRPYVYHNSCLYRAFRAVCQRHFGVDVSASWSVFKSYDDHGLGIKVSDSVEAINKAGKPWGISVKVVLGNVTEVPFPDLVLSGTHEVPRWSILLVDGGEHATTYWELEDPSCNAAIVLQRENGHANLR